MPLRLEENEDPSRPSDSSGRSERVQEVIATHRTPRQRLHAALQAMATEGLLSGQVHIDSFVDEIFGPPGVHARTGGGVTPGRRV